MTFCNSLWFKKIRKFNFYDSFRFIAKLTGKYKEFHILPVPPHTAIFIRDSQHHSGTRVTVNKPALVHGHHSEFRGCIRTDAGAVSSMGLDRYVRTWMSYGIVSSLKTCSLCPSLSPNFGNRWSFHCLLSCCLFRTTDSWNHILQIAFFHLGLCI